MAKSFVSVKIAFFLISLNGGGAERVMVTLANTVAKLGADVELVVGKLDGPYVKEISNKVVVVELKQSRAIRCLLPLSSYLKKSKPDICFSTLDYINVIVILANLIAGNPSKIVVREASTFSENIKTAKKIVKLLLPKLIKHLYPLAYKIVAVSNGVKENLICQFGLPKDKIKVIYNPVDFEKIQSLSENKVAHKWLEACERKEFPVILAVGRFSVAKDYPTLLRAFASLVEKTNARLIVLGEGECMSQAIKISNDLGIEKHVSFPGFVDNPFPYMKLSEVFVLSSIYEGMPNSLLQATVLGCKIVSTDCLSGPNEILENGKYGSLVAVGDYKAMAEAILCQLNSTKYEKKLRRLKKFDSVTIARQYLSCMDF
ncbi:MAG: glycosyl transferase [Flavobacterium sp.]|nr:glycosyl transferase [Flavobacterium sp.]